MAPIKRKGNVAEDATTQKRGVECIASVRPLQTWSSERKRKEIWMKDILLDVGRFARDKRKVTTSRSFGSGS